MAEITPLQMTAHTALRLIRELAVDSENIVIIQHSSKRMKQRKVSRRQIELCIQKGTITEGPFFNQYGNWQVNLSRHAAGEEITCTVAIEWGTQLIVVTVY